MASGRPTREGAAHSATATRWPSITAAWARRGARQSPTRWTGNGASLELAPQPVVGLLVDGAHHPVAGTQLVPAGRVVLEGEDHPAVGPSDTPMGTRSVLWLIPLAWALTFQVSMSSVMPRS